MPCAQIKHIILLSSILLFAGVNCTQNTVTRDDAVVLEQMKDSLRHNLLDSWYPRSIDSENGGFHTVFDYKWDLISSFPKGLVTQTRGVWASSKAAMRYPDQPQFSTAAEHGYRFLRDKAWDTEYGGFYEIIPIKNAPSAKNGKTAYGNAFAIYALSAYYEYSRSAEALELAKTAFEWLDDHFHDPLHGGYFNHADRQGMTVRHAKKEELRPDAAFKDYNSSIHIMEAFTALYELWPDAVLHDRLLEIFTIVRDTMTTSDGYLHMFFTDDWQHLSFSDSSRSYLKKNSYLDHVSFGHDVETAFLLLETESVLGHPDRERTLEIARNMVNHAIRYGFADNDGIYYEGYYFKGDRTLTIINPDKQWWVQAEGLNALLMMSLLFPDDHRYKDYFYKLWQFTKTYQIDSEHGGWYRSAIDMAPERSKRAPKSDAWKSCYHNVRSLAQCVDMLETGSIAFLQHE